MAPKPQLTIPIPPNPYTSLRSHLALTSTGSPVHERKDLQVQLKSAVMRLTSNGPTPSIVVPREVDEQYYNDNDAGSNYGDLEGDESEKTEITTQSVPESEFLGEHRHHNMCSPGSYAEFAINPYSSASVDRLHSSMPYSKKKSKQDYFTLPKRASQKRRRADVREACQMFVRPRAEDMGETLERLSSNLSSAYSAIKAEELASLRLLQELCD
ncbi:hypothetical protein F5Y06DRAFT_303104 [Hypoxylon sp. FL0890]|nr:hypothetical protein F5Y06DRAFT_303104 [Hypoxylon sp. FL0890]